MSRKRSQTGHTGVDATPEQRRTHRIWGAMKRRCYDKNFRGYETHGAQGVRVFWEWLDYDAFVRDMGVCPDGHSLDRINPEDGYSPWNCRWIPMAENSRRVRRQTDRHTKRTAVGPDGVARTLTLEAWAELLGMKYTSLLRRLERGWGQRAFRSRGRE